jgi:hypothetical protein
MVIIALIMSEVLRRAIGAQGAGFRRIQAISGKGASAASPASAEAARPVAAGTICPR